MIITSEVTSVDELYLCLSIALPILKTKRLCRFQGVRGWLKNFIKIIVRRFRWGFVLAGFTALAMAVISWTLENTETYWIWHRYDIIMKISHSLSPSRSLALSHDWLIDWLLMPEIICSIWHVSIYTSSFFFLCSKASTESTENTVDTGIVDTENQRPPNGAYELTRQDSFSRSW